MSKSLAFRVHLALAFGCAAASFAGDPAEAPVHRHLLPPEGLVGPLTSRDLTVLPWSELGTTLEAGKAARAAAAKPPPPAGEHRLRDLALEITAEAGETSARFVLKGTLETTDDGYRTVGLVSGGTPDSFEATQTGRRNAAAWLVPAEGGFGALVEGKGIRNFVLSGYTGVEEEGHLRRITLRLPPVAGTRLRATLPGDQLEVFTDPAPETRVVSRQGGRTVVEASVPPGSPVMVQCFPRDAGLQPATDREEAGRGPSGLELLGAHTQATWAQTLVFGHGRMEARVRLDVQASRAPIETLQIRFSPPVDDLTLPSQPGLVERADKVPGGLDVRLKGGRIGALRLELEYRVSEGKPSFKVQVPQPRLEGTAMERSYLWVGRSTNVKLSHPPREHFEPLAPAGYSDFPAAEGVQEPLMQLERVDANAPLEFEVHRYPDAPGVLTRVIASAQLETRLSAFGRAATSVSLRVRDRSGEPLALTLPSAATPTGFRVRGNRVDPARDREGRYSLTLRDETAGEDEEVEVGFEYLEDVAPLGAMGRLDLAGPKLGCQVLELGWKVTPPARFTLRGSSAPGTGSGELGLVRLGVPPEGDALRIRGRYFSDATLTWLHAGATVLGLWSGLLACRLMVGALPLAFGLGLAIPLVLLLALGDPRLSDRFAEAALAACAIGVLVGLRRGIGHYRSRRRETRRRRAGLAADLATFRARALEAARKSGALAAPAPGAAPQGPGAGSGEPGKEGPGPAAGAGSEATPGASPGTGTAATAPGADVPPSPPQSPPPEPPAAEGESRGASKGKGRKGSR